MAHLDDRGLEPGPSQSHHGESSVQPSGGAALTATGPAAEKPPPCNVEAFVERVGGDTELAREMAVLFVPDALRLLDSLQTAVENDDAGRIREDAHALKGSAGNFDAAPTVAGASALEMMGKSGELGDARMVFATLHADALELIAALRLFGESPA